MDALPHEIIEYILMNPILSSQDVVNFSSTCSEYRELVNSSRSIWKVKYQQCWPRTNVNIITNDWHEEFISRKKFEHKAIEKLDTMAAKFFNLDMKNVFLDDNDFELVTSHKHGYYYLRDFLLSINSLPLTQSLTHKYYSNILLKFINKRHNEEVWNNLLKLRVEEQTLEKGAIFVSLWCQEDARGIWEKVTSDLDRTAEMVKQCVFQNFKEHPLRNVPEETLSTWKKENIPGNMFEPNDCKAILSSINYVLFEHLKYWVRGDLKDFVKNKCGIDHALLDKRATPIIFAVIYESIARRLGVKIEVLDFQDHCLLKWREHYGVEGAPSHYINMDSRVLFIKSRCPRRFSSYITIASCNMQQIAERAALYIYPRDQGEVLSLRDALELLLVIKPNNVGCYLELSRLYMLNEMDSRDLLLKLHKLSTQMSEAEWRPFQPLVHPLELYQLTWDHNFNFRTPPPQCRGPEVDFAVGMIVRDKLCDRTGVIYGWNIIIGPTEKNSSQGRSQVSYKVLLDDGSYEYVPQETLQILHSPPFISHPSIGRFFDEYCTTYYKPNKELLADYPGDMEALQRILKKDRKT